MIEAKAVGRASTAASTALLMQEPDEDSTGLAHRYGEKRARRIRELSQIATQEFVEVIRKLEIEW